MTKKAVIVRAAFCAHQCSVRAETTEATTTETEAQETVAAKEPEATADDEDIQIADGDDS